MKYLLDTNAAGHADLERPNRDFLALFQEHRGEIALCAPSYFELRHGEQRLRQMNPAKSAKHRDFIDRLLGMFPLLAFDEPSAREAARRFAHLESRGRTPGWVDCAIASTAAIHGLTVVTNDGDFLDLEVPVEDWTQPDRRLRRGGRRARPS